MSDTPTPTPDPATAGLISKAFAKRAAIALELLELEELTTKIIALGKGKHTGAEPAHTVTVVGASSGSAGKVSYELPEDGEARAREIAAHEFGNLFDRTVVFIPCKGFEDVAPKLLTPAKARDILALCFQKSGGSSGKKSYILWPK